MTTPLVQLEATATRVYCANPECRKPLGVLTPDSFRVTGVGKSEAVYLRGSSGWVTCVCGLRKDFSVR